MELQRNGYKIFDTQTFASGFQKRNGLLTQEQYQPISIEFLSDKIN